MRLTLRTLLAYMDDVLEPEDREDLKAKIEHSEFAADLLHRARDVMRRLRLGAPGVDELKKGMDANSVAEYLDNTMSPEQVADFERLCLESDVALAEVASCHQILTMVLGEPADVRPEARARMYDIPAESDLVAMRVAENDDGPPPSVLSRQEVPEIDVATSPASHVPDYLRESFWERHRGKLAIAAALLIGGMVYLFWPPEDPQTPREVADNVDELVQAPLVDEGESEPADSTQDGAPPEAPADDDGTGDDDASDAGNGGDQAGAPPFGASETPTEVADPLDTSVADDRGIPELPSGLANQATQPDAEAPRIELAPERSTEPLAGQDDLQLPGVANTPTTGEPLPPVPPLPTVEPAGRTNGAALPIPPATTDEGTTEQPADSSSDAAATSATTAVVEPPDGAVPDSGPKQVATYVSSGDILLRRANQNDWVRLVRLDRLFEGDQILALPASRPIITLPATNLSVQLQPATRIALDTGDLPNLGGDDARAGINVLYGRVVIFNPAQADAGPWVGLQLRLGDAVYGVELDGGSTLAIDARRELLPGVDPLVSSGEFVADVFTTTGRARWQAEGAVQTFEAPAQAHVAGGAVGPVQPLDSVPDWINEDTVLALDQLALRDVDPAIVPGRSARLSLAELADHRKQEVRGFVSRASIHVGDFEPFVKSLNDASQSRMWDEHIAVLQGAMALDQQVAERVREAFVNYKGQEAGEELFRLLWGYSKKQLEDGAIEELIEYLNHESLDFRVLAFNNLHRATGVKLLYSPQEQQPQRRERFIRAWRQRLVDNDLEIAPNGTGG